MIYDSGEIVTGYRHQFLVKLEWYMTLDFLYQSSFFQDGNPNFFLHLIFLNSLVQIPFIQLLEKSELSWTLEALQRETREGKRVGFLLAFHWKHPPHLSCSPKMEALRLLFKKLPCCYRHQETRLELLSASWWLSRKLANFKVLQPWTSQMKKSTLCSKWSNQEFKFFDWKKVEKAWLCYFNFWSKEYLQIIDPFITQTFWNFGIFCAPSLFRKSGQNYHEIHVFRFFYKFPFTTSPCLKIQVTLITSLFQFWKGKSSTLSISMCREEGLNGRALLFCFNLPPDIFWFFKDFSCCFGFSQSRDWNVVGQRIGFLIFTTAVENGQFQHIDDDRVGIIVVFCPASPLEFCCWPPYCFWWFHYKVKFRFSSKWHYRLLAENWQFKLKWMEIRFVR